MKTTTLVCDISGQRLDVYLADNIPGLTRSSAARLIETGHVALYRASDNNPISKALKKNHKTSTGEKYIVAQSEPDACAAEEQDILLDIVYEDIDVIAVNKPRGMVVHPAPGHRDNTLVNALLYHCGDNLSGIGGVIRPGIVHRIDKDTSGLIIAAKNDKAHLSLTQQLAARTLTREYDAIVCGNVKADDGTVDIPIGRHPRDRKKQAVFPASNAQARCRNAVTHYKTVSRYKGYTHISCRLETGRTHQIRVHMAHIGHPVLGDPLYGYKKPQLGQSSQCLHARKLRFIHPSSGQQIELCTDLPGYFADILHKLGALNEK